MSVDWDNVQTILPNWSTISGTALQTYSSQLMFKWLNPREGGDWKNGSVRSLDADGIVDLGDAPDSLDQNSCCIVSKLKL